MFDSIVKWNYCIGTINPNVNVCFFQQLKTINNQRCRKCVLTNNLVEYVTNMKNLTLIRVSIAKCKQSNLVWSLSSDIIFVTKKKVELTFLQCARAATAARSTDRIISSADSLTAADVINQQRRGSAFGFRDSISLPPGSIKTPLQHQISSPYPITASRSQSLQATLNPAEPVPVTCRRTYSAKKREGKKARSLRYERGTGETRRASYGNSLISLLQTDLKRQRTKKLCLSHIKWSFKLFHTVIRKCKAIFHTSKSRATKVTDIFDSLLLEPPCLPSKLADFFLQRILQPHLFPFMWCASYLKTTWNHFCPLHLTPCGTALLFFVQSYLALLLLLKYCLISNL